MKKLKIIFAFVCLYLSILLVHFYMLIFHWNSFPTNADGTVLGGSLAMFNAISAILYFIIFSSLGIGIWKIIKKGYFYQDASKFLSGAGLTLLVMGIINIIIDILNAFKMESSSSDSIFISGALSILMIVMGLSITFMVDVLKNGFQLKSENDLTI